MMQWKFGGIALFVLVALMGGIPSAATAWHANEVALHFTKGLVSKDANCMLVGSIPEQLTAMIETANVLRIHGLACLRGGDPELAVSALRRAQILKSDDSLIDLALADALLASGKFADAFRLYDALLDRYPYSLEILLHSETNYPGPFLSTISANECVPTMDVLLRMADRGFDSPNFFYDLGVWCEEYGVNDTATSGFENAKYFSIDSRISSYVQRLVPGLVQRGFLSTDDLARLASILVWQGHLADAESIIAMGLLAEPTASRWLELHGRLARMQGRVEDARQYFQSALGLNPQDANACRGLVQLMKEHENDLSVPECLEVAENDALLMSTEQPQITGASLRLSETDAIAQMLSINQENVSLGADILRFTPDSAAPWGMVGDGYEEADYYLGVDHNEALSSSSPLRASMLWSRPLTGSSPARAGYFGPKIDLSPSSVYVLSFYYRTETVADQGAGFYFPAFPDFMDYFFLPETDGQWRQFVLLGKVSQSLQSFWPYFAIFHKGHAWFDHVQVRQVTFNGADPDISSSLWSIK